MDIATMVSGIHLDRDAPVALHYQLSQGIQELIKNGFLAPGDRLPNVQEIAAGTGVSIATAMRAVGTLGRSGVLVSKRGMGTFVAETRPPMTEVLICDSMPTAGSYLWGFYQQLLDGLRDGFGQQDRRFTTTWTHGGDLSAAEILGGAQARRVDGLVAYRPDNEMLATLDSVARDMPLVSLYRLVPGGAADCVAGDATEAVRRMIRTRVERGRREFAYLGYRALVAEGEQHEAYTNVHGAWRDELEAQGVAVRELFSDVADPFAVDMMRETWAFVERAVADLPDGCCVMAQNPNFIHMMRGAHRRFDAITYTEYAHNLREWAGQVSFLYLGLEDLARAAAPLLRDPVQGSGPKARVVKVSPRVIEIPEHRAGGQ